MGIASSLETSVMIYQSTLRHILEGSTLHGRIRLVKRTFVIRAMNF
jgi:hypothetical protein